MASNLRRSKRSFGQRFLRAEEQIDSASKKPSPKRIGSRIVTSSNLAPGAITTVTLAPEVSTAIVYAQATADGKNTIYYQTSEPSGGIYAQDDIWFDTDDSHKMYRYNTSTSAWEGFQLGDNAIAELSADKLTAGTIDASTITVSNLDAGNLTSGTISAVDIGAVNITGATITGGTLNIGSGTFQVDSSGNLTATSATLSGKLSSNNVTVGSLTGVVTGASGLYISATTDNWLYQTSTGVNRFRAGAGNNQIRLDTGSTSENFVQLTGTQNLGSGTNQTNRIVMGYSTGSMNVYSDGVPYNSRAWTYDWNAQMYGEEVVVGNVDITGLYTITGNNDTRVVPAPTDAGQYVKFQAVSGNVDRFTATTRNSGELWVGATTDASLHYRTDHQSLYVNAQPRFEMRQSGTWSVSSGADVSLSWNVGVHARPTSADTLTEWWTGSNPVNFRCPVDGWYMFSAQVLLDNTVVSGNRQIHLVVTRASGWTTDNRYGTQGFYGSSGGSSALSTSAVFRCRAGDTVKVVAYQNTGSTLTWGNNRRDINTFTGILLFGATSNYWV